MAGTLKRVWLIERQIYPLQGCGALWETTGFPADLSKRQAEAEVLRLNAKPRIEGEVWWKYQVREYIRKDRCLRYDG